MARTLLRQVRSGTRPWGGAAERAALRRRGAQPRGLDRGGGAAEREPHRGGGLPGLRAAVAAGGGLLARGAGDAPPVQPNARNLLQAGETSIKSAIVVIEGGRKSF